MAEMPFCPMHPDVRLRSLTMRLHEPTEYVHADGSWHLDMTSALLSPSRSVSVQSPGRYEITRADGTVIRGIAETARASVADVSGIRITPRSSS